MSALPEDACVSVFKVEGVSYISQGQLDAATVLEHATRSETLSEMPEGQGHTTLPIPREGIRLWQDSVTGMLSGSAWDVSRIKDLCMVAQVCQSLQINVTGGH